MNNNERPFDFAVEQGDVASNPQQQPSQTKRKSPDESEEKMAAAPAATEQSSESNQPTQPMTFFTPEVSKITEVEGSLLDSPATFIAHQCNCISTEGKGLSDLMFKRYPYADVYKARKGAGKDGKDARDKPGEIKVGGNGRDKRYVINMFAQNYPGGPKPNYDDDEKRVGWFKSCLNKILELEKIPGLVDEKTSIAFPSNIGCGLGGGCWDLYREALDEFANKTTMKVYLYKFKPVATFEFGANFGTPFTGHDDKRKKFFMDNGNDEITNAVPPPQPQPQQPPTTK